MEKLEILNELREFYAGKRIFLTGHTGFKGAWMLFLLRELGADVSGYSLAPLHKNDLYVLAGGESLCNSRIADIRDRESVEAAISAVRPDLIFHLAAQPLVRESYRRPLETFDTNIMGSV
ncbi:MAG: GDP-mannose 4,6-dehydratase, partial [Candidatus Neomarinimicrobiota bacterium]